MLSMIAGLGIDFIKDMVMDKGEELVVQGIKKATGIDVKGKKSLTKDEIEQIKISRVDINKELELLYKDKQNARKMAMEISINGKDWLVRNTGSIVALSVVLFSFVLFVLLLTGNLSIENSSVAMIVGFAGGYVTQILSFYFGSSKNEADSFKA